MPLRFFAVLLFASLSARAAVTVPVEVADGLLWVNVDCEGRKQPLRFVVDSGAAESFLDREVVHKLGLSLGRTVAVDSVSGSTTGVRVARFDGSLRGIPLPSHPIMLELSTLPARTKNHLDGILGGDFFREHAVEFDTEKREMRILSSSEAADQPGFVLPLVNRSGALCVRTTINGEPALLRVDTGCAFPIEWTPSQRVDATGMAVTLQIGPVRIQGVHARVRKGRIFPREDGLLGTTALEPFIFTIDAPARLLVLFPRNGKNVSPRGSRVLIPTRP